MNKIIMLILVAAVVFPTKIFAAQNTALAYSRLALIDPTTGVDDGSDDTQSANTTPPTILLIGDNTATLNVGDSFVDPGVTAYDSSEEDLTDSVLVNNTVNTAVAGTYTVTYQVTDADGNNASVIRTVVVSTAAAKNGTPPTKDLAVPSPDNTPAINDIPVVPVAEVAPQSTPAPTPTSATSGFWSFIPFASKKPKTPTSVSPSVSIRTTPAVTANSKNTKKSYDIVFTQYTLNGVLIHASDGYDSTWQLDTKTLQNGTYTLNTSIHYADGTTDNGSDTFTVDNTPSFISRVLTSIGNLFKKNKN